MLYALLGIVLFVILLLIRLKIYFKITVAQTDAHIRASAGLLFGAIRIPLWYRIYYTEEKGLRVERVGAKGRVKKILWPREKGPETPEKKAKEKAEWLPARTIFDLLASLHVRRLHIETRLGLDNDAYHTALLCGGLRIILGAVEGILKTRESRIDMWSRVWPDFQQKKVDIKLDCIICIYLEHIIRALLRHARKKNLSKRGSVEHATASN